MEIKITFLLLLIVLAQSGTTPLSILQVSSKPDVVSNPVYSSLRGGRLIYIKAMGHSPDPTDNLVYVGTYPCIIPSDGVTDTFISCYTGDTGSTDNINNLPVTLISYGTAVTTSYPNTVYYSNSYTPQLYDVFPSAGYSGSDVNFYGIHRITDLGDGLRFMGDVTRIRLGEDMCSRFDVQQAALSSTYTTAYVRCIQSTQQEAGKYNASEQVVPGFAAHSKYMRRSSFDSQEYFQFSVLPTVTAVSPADGNIGGQYLTISGTGFSANTKNNTVTVDGNKCEVTAVTQNQIKCTVSPRNNLVSSQLVTNATSPQNSFFSGAGLSYARYPLSSAIDTISEFVAAVRAENTVALGTPLQKGYRADLREGNVHENTYSQVWRGYFTAPVNGTYKFRGVADDYFAFYISDDYGSTGTISAPLIYSNIYQLFWQFYDKEVDTAEATKDLVAGKSYYIEAYNINGGGTGFFDLAVEIPNSDDKAFLQTYQVDKITTNSTVTPQLRTFTMAGATTGTIELSLIDRNPTTYAITYQKRVNVSYGCDAATFQAALNSFYLYSSYKVTVERKIYDGSNNLLPDTTGAVKIEYIASIYLLRSTTYQTRSLTKTFYDSYDGTWAEAASQAHSSLLSGTFTLSIGGVAINVNSVPDISYAVSASDLQTAIRSAGIVGFGDVEVSQVSDYGCGYSCTWIIRYKGVNAAVPLASVNGAGLTTAPNPTINAVTRRSYSPNIIFDPIDYRFLNTYSGAINVQVTTNGVPSICTGTCLYSFNIYTEITSLSRSGAVLSLALSDPTTINFNINTISVSVGGLPCAIVGGSTFSSLTCNMQTNTDSTPILVAGAVTPVVSISPYGIAGLASGVNPLSVSLVASNLSVTTGGNNGGYLITLNGAGFPLDKSQMSITICGNKATIKTITNIYANFFVPSCGSLGTQTVTVAVGSASDTSLTFSYTDASSTAPSITLLEPASANPGLKGVLYINGNNFGASNSGVQVFLSNATGKIYTLNIFQQNNTYIKAGLPGGLPGTFTVQVNNPTTGDSIAASAGSNQFKYVFKINSISPVTGSYNGGTLLTITGENFSNDTQNTQVYVGDTLNWFCTIESITSTQILCRTPAISKYYAVGSPVAVVAATRLIILNECGGVCNFTYMASGDSPSLTAISATSASISGTSTKTITLTGTNLIDSNSFAQVALTHKISGKTTIFSSASATSTSVTFTLTSAVLSGNYYVKVRNQIGQTNAKEIAINWSPGTASWGAGGSTAGGIIKISNGGGYPTSIDGLTFAISVTVNSVSYPFKISSCCSSNTIELEMPSGNNGTIFVIKFTGPVNSVQYTYTLLTSLTPTASITSSTTLSVGANTITVSASNSVSATIDKIKLVSVFNKNDVISVDNATVSVTGTGATAVTTFNANLNAGAYKVFVSTNPNGYISIANSINVNFPTNVNTNNQQMSFNGGTFTISASDLSPVSYITVNGFRGNIISYSTSAVTYSVPALVTPSTQTAFSLVKPTLLDNSQFTFFSDQSASVSNVSASFDGLVNTYYGSSNAVCYLGLDAGSGLQVAVNRIRLFPSLDWANVGKKILQATVQGSNDMSTWTTLATVDQTIHSGWNVLKSLVSTPFRYVRFYHNSTSGCNIAELQLNGIIYSTLSVTLASQTADVVYVDGFNTKTFTNAIEYREDHTPVVTSVSPRYGDVFGNYIITLTGTNLNAGAAVISIDGVSCPVATSSATTITCTVGARPNTPTVDNTFKVTIGSSNALLKDSFLYVLKWSNPTTWGVDTPPIDKDLVYVPTGTTLFVDQDTPLLEGIVVEGGTLVFSDELDLTVKAGFITLSKGRFIAGTEEHPHTHKLTFVMSGGYYGKQQPMFGNKGIGCLNCKFSMYGQPRAITWTKITATINPTDTTLTVADTIDWQVGEEIVVASTSFVHQEAERRTITAVSGKTITVNAPFEFKHVSVVETHGSDKLAMQAEVGLLTRNIKMRGDDESELKQYGSHLMLTGQVVDGFEGYVGYTEFFHCGQPQILGRYCIHFHMVGDIPDSFARGNAVHDSFARVITIHGVHYLTVQDNVGYKVKGHNFFVEDGIETHNLIKHNLAIGSIATTRMLQTDTSVASFWITHPSNDLIGNVAAGSDFYGIWYELKEHPDGPSATMDVCPMGNSLGTVSNIISHSNVRFGLRVFILAPRLYPCDPLRNDTDPNDPWSYNPSVQSVFSNFTIYKNLQDGVLSEETGNVVYDNFIIAENYHSGVEFYVSNYTKEPPTVRNSAIIGMSTSNAHSNTTNYTSGMSAAITGRTGAHKLSNIRFYNYPAGSVLFQTCRFCDDLLKYTNLGTETFVEQLTFNNISGKWLFMIGLKRDVIYDLDGSLSSDFDGNSRASGTIVHGWPHIASTNQNTCPYASTSTDWDDAVMCGPTITIRRVTFTNLENHQLYTAQRMKAVELQGINDTVNPNISYLLHTNITSRLINTVAMEPKFEKSYSYGLPFITGRIYNIWWGTGIDFTHLSITSTSLFTESDAGIIFKFNYTQNREIFEVGPMRGGSKVLTALDFISQSATELNPATCQNGQFYHNNIEGPLRMMEICQSGKNRAKFEYTQVNGIVCRYLCPAPTGIFIKEAFTRMWSNATQWPNGVVPQAGDDVVVNGNWTVILDVDPAPLNYLIIDGTVIADDTRDVNITANSIHIRAGNLSAGRPDAPFLHNFVVQINGLRTDNGWTIDPTLAGRKYMVVTGILNLHGVAPTTVTTFLTQTVASGSSTIFVDSSTDWAVGDTIVLSPSFSTYNQYQKKTIQAINADGSITLSSALQYTHYGSTSFTIDNNYGKLDTRTRVGHVNRNVKIVPGPDAGWGFTVIVYAYLDNTIVRVGSVDLSGVQFQDGGQLDSLNAPLTFLSAKNGNYSSKVTETSFVNCKASCIYIKDSQNITMTNNVFYDTYNFGAQIGGVQSVTFSNNLIIGVYTQPTLEENSILVACVYVEEYINPSSLVAIKNNFCHGSSQHGFAFPFTKCTEFETNPLANNTVGSAKIGFIINTIGDQCQAFSYAKAFACTIGQICGPPSITTTKFDHFIMADNERSITLKIGASEGGSDHTAYLYNSYITALSRPNCTQCYGASRTICSNTVGIRMLTASANGEVLPAKHGTGFDVVCKQPVYDSKSFLVNVTFDSFRQSYTGFSGLCSSNFIFTPNRGGFDQVGNANLFTSKCVNCDTDSYLTAPVPSESFLGWFGGCGDMVCTGFQNYLIQDWTGTVFGFTGTIIPNNSVIAANEGCTFSAPMNAYMCQNRLDFGVLEYQNIAADFKTRIMWPVNLTYQGASYTTVTNGWREWDWLGKEPRNHRFGRFVSIVNIGKQYNMTFASQPPEKLQLKLQKHSDNGDNNRFIIVKLHYPKPNSIRLLLDNKIVDPILLTDLNNTTPGLKENLNTSVCGSNIYFYTNYTITFVVTEDPNCMVTIQLTETVQLTTHFSIDINLFFNSNDAITNFINNICGLLNIVDTSRVKVVGVFNGSTIIVLAITPPVDPTNSTDPSLPEIAAAITTGTSSGTLTSGLSGIGLGTPLGVSSVYYPITQTSSTSSSSSNIGLIVGVSVAGVVLLIGAIVTVVCCMRRRAKVVEQVVSNEDEVMPQKEGDQKGNTHFMFSASDGHQIPNESEIKIKNSKSKQNVLNVHELGDNSEVIEP